MMLPLRNRFRRLLRCSATGIRVALSLLVLAVSSAAWAATTPVLRIVLTPIIAYDQLRLTEDLRKYVESRFGRPVEFVRRESYREAIDLVAQNRVDFGWVSVYPFVYLQNHFHLRLLATPVYRGQPFFRAYLIVPAEDAATNSLLQLEGRIFAYADSYSFSGYLLPRYELHEAGKDAASFFAKTIFTKSHKQVVRAVASGLADGGYVDGYIWDTLDATEPSLTARTRIVGMSHPHGFPPLVASSRVSDKDFAAMRRILTDMSADPEGARLLRRLNLDGFVAGDPGWYAEAARMMRVMGDL